MDPDHVDVEEFLHMISLGEASQHEDVLIQETYGFHQTKGWVVAPNAHPGAGQSCFSGKPSQLGTQVWPSHTHGNKNSIKKIQRH